MYETDHTHASVLTVSRITLEKKKFYAHLYFIFSVLGWLTGKFLYSFWLLWSFLLFIALVLVVLAQRTPTMDQITMVLQFPWIWIFFDVSIMLYSCVCVESTRLWLTNRNEQRNPFSMWKQHHRASCVDWIETVVSFSPTVLSRDHICNLEFFICSSNQERCCQSAFFLLWFRRVYSSGTLWWQPLVHLDIILYTHTHTRTWHGSSFVFLWRWASGSVRAQARP